LQRPSHPMIGVFRYAMVAKSS